MKVSDDAQNTKRKPTWTYDEDEPPLRVKRISENALLPTRASPGAAGYDLHAAEDGIIHPGTRVPVNTDLKLQIPERYYGRVVPRSGLSIKKGVTTVAGVIDCDYRGPLGVVLVNNGTNTFEFKKHDRIAQLILTRYGTPKVIEETGELEETERGAKGFGSTGRGALTESEPAAPTDTELPDVSEEAW